MLIDADSDSDSDSFYELTAKWADFVLHGSPHWDARVPAPTNLRAAPSLFLCFVSVCACATALPLQPGQGGSDDANDDDAELTGHTDAVLFPPQFRHFAAPL